MSPFKSYVDDALGIWNDSAPAARVGIVLLMALCVSAIVGVGYWSAQPSYVTLISEADHEKMDRVIDALDKANIKYSLSGAGGNLRVDKSDYSKARMLARGAGVATAQGADMGIGNAFSSPSDRRRLALIKKQQSLAATIRKMNVIEQVDVHLNVPDKGPFERNHSPPSASVMITLLPGSRLSDFQAQSIASLVAFAVEDLDPESVQITDKDGRSYTVADEGMHQIKSQIEFTTETEKRLARKAETQLLHFLGHGNASVQVSLDLTFTNGSKTITSYDAEGKVPNEEDLNTETTKNATPGSVGGVEPNIGNAPVQSAASGVESKTETIKTSYLVPKTEEVQSNTTPIRNLMTVSVLVNSAAENLKGADGNVLPGINERVRAIVENAVGFKKDSDTISVELLPFPEIAPEEEYVPPYDWSQWKEIVRNASLAIGAIVALLIGFLTLKKIKPSEPTQTVEPVVVLDESRSQSIERLVHLANENPEVFAQIIQNWADSPQQGSNESEQRAA